MTEAKREPIGDSVDEVDEGDFAGEHADVTYADDQVDGPERAKEPESPEGLAGMD